MSREAFKRITDDRVSASLLTFGWSAALLGYALLSIWLLSHPPSLPSDDALFFQRGIERFSVLEFRPHFPGYPLFILLGKVLYALTGDSAQALFLLSNLAALSLPPLSALVVRGTQAGTGATLLTFVLALLNPLLPLLGLSLLSDGSGIAALLLFLLALQRRSWLLSGLLLGVVLGFRPSFVTPVAAAFLVVLFTSPKPWRFTLGCLLSSALTFGSVLLLEGPPLLWEGLRFTLGHFQIWGNTAVTETTRETSWLSAITALPDYGLYTGVLLAAALLSCCHRAVLPHGSSPLPVIATLLLSSLLWTLFFQNPENLRHLGIVTVCATLMAGSSQKLFSRFCTLILLPAGMVLIVVQSPFSSHGQAPMSQAIEFLQKQQSGLLITNHGVVLLRRELPDWRVGDAYYRASTTFQSNQKRLPVWRLSSTPPAPSSLAGPGHSFPPRVIGEKPLWLWPVAP